MAYITRENLDLLYGTRNVEAYANVSRLDENDPDYNDTLTARIEFAINAAESRVDQIFRGGGIYSVPLLFNSVDYDFISTVAKLTIADLYLLSGLTEDKNRFEMLREDAEHKLFATARGEGYRLDAEYEAQYTAPSGIDL
jgi:hypothetical protein